jgi:hypothetical protein
VSVLAFKPVDLGDRASELKNGVTNIIADEVYAEPGETVSFRVMLKNNTGYAPSGISLTYDSALKPVLTEDGKKPDLTWGDGCYGLTKGGSINLDKHLIGYGSSGTDNCERDGAIYTAKFVVPADAKDGTVYPLTLNVDKFLDAKTDPVAYNAVNGWIRVQLPAETTTSTTASSVTTVTTSKTTVSSEPTTSSSVSTSTSSSTPTVTVTTLIQTDVSTVSNTSKTDRQDPGSEPTTASRDNSVTQTTKKPASSSTTTTATKTGDAGVGVAVAGLMLAGAAAMICKQKKEH